MYILEPHLFEYQIPGDQRAWLTPEEFTEGKEYYWRIQAGGESQTLQSDWTEPIKFYTGPLCSSNYLEDIISVHPRGGVIIFREEPIKFNWERTGYNCLPPGYYIEIYPDVELDDMEAQLVAEYWIDDPDNEFEASPGLACEDYKWRVTPLGFDSMDSVIGLFMYSDFAYSSIENDSCKPPATIEAIRDCP